MTQDEIGKALDDAVNSMSEAPAYAIYGERCKRVENIVTTACLLVEFPVKLSLCYDAPLENLVRYNLQWPQEDGSYIEGWCFMDYKTLDAGTDAAHIELLRKWLVDEQSGAHDGAEYRKS